MSVEDGRVMHLNVGSFRDHDPALLARFGNDQRRRLILFTLDKSVYSREFAPLAGYDPALTIGPPVWFHDSLHGIANFAGFDDEATAAEMAAELASGLTRRAYRPGMFP